jgi:CspA family cold shock protein
MKNEKIILHLFFFLPFTKNVKKVFDIPNGDVMSKEYGIVKWFDETKNFGFITPESGAKDLFFHRSDLETMGQSIEKGERVEFEVGSGPKGPQAKHVNLLEG